VARGVVEKCPIPGVSCGKHSDIFTARGKGMKNMLEYDFSPPVAVREWFLPPRDIKLDRFVSQDDKQDAVYMPGRWGIDCGNLDSRANWVPFWGLLTRFWKMVRKLPQGSTINMAKWILMLLEEEFGFVGNYSIVNTILARNGHG
jgi:hypothetical protein